MRGLQVGPFLGLKRLTNLTTLTAVTQLHPKIRFECARRANQMSESQSKLQTF